MGNLVLRLALASIAAAGLLATPAVASITVGSDLNGPLPPVPTGDQCSGAAPPCSHLLLATHKGNAFPATSPANGTVTGFNIKTAASGKVIFRIGQVKVNTRGVTTGTGPTADLPAAGTYFFPANLPIKIGDSVGFDSTSHLAAGACFDGGLYFVYSPLLVDGVTEGTPPVVGGTGSACELMVNAVVRPSNTIGFSELTRDEAKGSAAQQLKLPGPGELVLSGGGIRKVTRSAAAGADALRPILPVNATGETRQRLNRNGSVKVTLKFKFTPTGGKAKTRSKTIKLVKG